MEASRCAYKRNITLNSVRQQNYFITQGNYIGYMFRLLNSHLQAYFCHLSHKMLCTFWDSIVCLEGCDVHVTPFETNDLILCIPRF